MSKGAEAQRVKGDMTFFALTIFLSAFLLFQVQPIISKYILPWYGGTTTVWTTCLLFFQLALLAGYGYAHLLTKFFTLRYQVATHLFIIALSFIVLPIIPSESWKPLPTDDPILSIFVLLSATIGLPYFVLSATSPLMQRWISDSHSNVTPYRFFALSNAGSLLALVSFPFLVEPNFTRQSQAFIWSGGLVLYGIFAGTTGIKLWKQKRGVEPNETYQPYQREKENLTVREIILWLGFPATASMMLLATTHKLCQEVAVVPFLWIVPLTLYLLSFIISFDKEKWYSRIVFVILFLISLSTLIWLGVNESDHSLLPIFLTYPLLLFVVNMICHGEVARLKPHPRRLTTYYLFIALGGAIGSSFVVLVAPLLFNDHSEFSVGIILTIIFLLTAVYNDTRSRLYQGKPRWAWLIIVVAMIPGTFLLFTYKDVEAETIIARTRNFYGTNKVEEYDLGGTRLHLRALTNGLIIHGTQFMDPEVRQLPTTYYSHESGLGVCFYNFPRTESLRVGAVGLGVGTVAAWIDSGDYIRFYEINPEVRMLAEQYFYFLNDVKGKRDIIMGDARLSLEQEPPQQFDILILDAFNSDTPPVHLLTVEAFETYFRHVKSDGVIAVHISSKFLDFYAMLASMAEHFSLGYRVISHINVNKEYHQHTSIWLLMSRNDEFLNHPEVLKVSALNPQRTLVHPWTDNYSSLFPILFW